MGHMDGHFEPLDDCLGPLAYHLRLPDGDGICSDNLWWWWWWWCCGSGGSGIIVVVLVLLLAMVVVIVVVVLLWQK